MASVVQTTPTAVVIRFAKMNGMLTRIELPYETSTQAIAQTVVDLISSGMSMDIGDMITVTASP